MIKKNVMIAVAIAMFSLMVLPSQLFSQNYQDYDNWTTDTDMQWWNNDVPSRYALSADQIAKVNDIRAKSSKKILPLQNKLYSLRNNLRGHNGYDVQELQSYRNRMSRLENKISEINLATRVQIQKVLGNNQLTYFNTGGYGWWNMADDCWYSPNTVSSRGYGRPVYSDYYDRCRW
jgi:Spy/CpxP family protein refolding chaperone